MADATFNGDTMIVTLPMGGASHFIDVAKDLYSAWKRWMTADYQNQGYPPVFIAADGSDGAKGGFEVNPTTGLKAGAYFFFNNRDGWHIRPAEEDATIYFVGNLLPNDFDHNILMPTIGAYTVLIDGLQPITQIAPGSVAAADVWAYSMTSGNTAEEEQIAARRNAQNAFAVSA